MCDYEITFDMIKQFENMDYKGYQPELMASLVKRSLEILSQNKNYAELSDLEKIVVTVTYMLHTNTLSRIYTYKHFTDDISGMSVTMWYVIKLYEHRVEIVNLYTNCVEKCLDYRFTEFKFTHEE